MKSFRRAASDAVILFSCLLSAVSCGGNGSTSKGPVKLENDMDTVSYCIGYDIGTQIKNEFISSDIEINNALFIRAMEDVLNGAIPAISPDSMRTVLATFQEKLMAERQVSQSRLIVENRAAASKFLAENAVKPIIYDAILDDK